MQGAGQWSLRVPFVIVLFGILFVLFVLFVFFFVWLFSNKDIGSYRAIRGFWVEVFSMYSAHAQMVRSILEMLLRNMGIYQPKITLMDLRGLIWRRIQVQDTVNLAQLHKVLQIVMGWENSHLHRFTVDRRRHLETFDSSDNQHHHASKVTLRLLFGEQDIKFLYYEYELR